MATGWILELDRGQGIPFEGNYSEWLTNKAARFAAEASKQSSVQKAMSEELEWINSNAKGQQKKGKVCVALRAFFPFNVCLVNCGLND